MSVEKLVSPMTEAEVLSRRMAAQFRVPQGLNGVVDVLRYLVAVQGQEYDQTKWGLSLRCDGVADDSIEALLVAGRIRRTHLLRPTWHFIADDDLGWVLALTAPNVHQANKFMYKKLELDAATLAAANGTLERALSGGGSLTREVLAAELAAGGIAADGLRLGYIMMHAELEGLIASGPRQGKQFTYQLLAPRPEVDRDEALVRLTSAYFTSRGPATAHDCATWSGLSVKDVKTGLELARPALARAEVAGTVYYFADWGLEPPRDELYLLPIYDEYIMGYKDRALYFSSEGSPPMTYDSMVLFDGRVIGTWRRTLGREVAVELALPAELGRSLTQRLEQALARLGRFYGKPVRVT